MRVLRNVLAALYGQGDGKLAAPAARHTQVTSALRRRLDDLENASWASIIAALKAEGLTAESVCLLDSRRIRAAEHLLDSSQIITAACDVYPNFLIKRLQHKAPPVLWISDTELALNPPWLANGEETVPILAGLGCRQPLTLSIVIARQVGQYVAKRNFLGLTGGAIGCDHSFAEGVVGSGGTLLNILPCGLNQALWSVQGYAMSAYPPDAPFNSAQAMERNGVIYAMATGSILCSARFRLGGSWHGATTALRSKQPVGIVDWSSKAPMNHLVQQQQGTYGVAQRALVSQGGFSLAVDLQNLASSLTEHLDQFSEWAILKRSGSYDVGLFAS